MNDNDVDMETILKRFALWGGIALAIISIYFSYDGADQTIQGGNPTYSEVAKYIMIVMACVVTLAQFIFNSDFTKLSTTMRVIGLISYVYSLTTNYMGINHLFGFEGFVGGMIAIFMDVAPEAFIAWSLDDSLRGDMLGNIGKFVTGVGSGGGRRSKKTYSSEAPRPERVERHEPLYEPVTQPKMPAYRPQQPQQGKGQGSKRRQFLEDANKSKNSGKGNFFGE
jgi:uncharacterized membrane protein